jgi:hypothetical protein
VLEVDEEASWRRIRLEGKEALEEDVRDEEEEELIGREEADKEGTAAAAAEDFAAREARDDGQLMIKSTQEIDITYTSDGRQPLMKTTRRRVRRDVNAEDELKVQKEKGRGEANWCLCLFFDGLDGAKVRKRGTYSREGRGGRGRRLVLVIRVGRKEACEAFTPRDQHEARLCERMSCRPLTLHRSGTVRGQDGR